MASWLTHPKYVPVRDRLIKHLSSRWYRFRRVDPVLFLCGGSQSPRRDSLRDYLRKTNPHLGLFYAERVWEHIASRANSGALKIEADLADLADLVVVVVESPGTFAELGAFSLSDRLRKKLLAILDERYREDPSFINTGPVQWINQESDFKPVIYGPLDRILETVDQIEERIERIASPKLVAISDLSLSPKHLLFFLCDLIAVIHPATVEMVNYYLARIAPSLSGGENAHTLIGLAEAMGLLSAHGILSGEKKQVFFSPATHDALERPFNEDSQLDLQSQRAAQVAVLQSVDQAKAVLYQLRKAP
jgi:hypothetical protein